ncbi:hypothetical protein WJX79_004648 [Trebouxia sp. C0005]
MASCLLYKWQSGWGLPSVSPACIQVEAYLRFAATDFAVESCNYTHTSPTGHQPAVDTSGEVVAEDEAYQSARAIIQHLKQHTKDIDAELSDSDRADLIAFRTLVQNALEPATQYTLWCEAESFSKHTQVKYGHGMPFPLNYILPRIHQFHVWQILKLTTADQMYTSLADAYAAIAERLSASDGDYFFGGKPSSLDALLYGHLAFHQAAPVTSPEIRHQISQHPVLQKYVDRISKDVFQRPVPFASASMSQEWQRRADAAAGGSRNAADNKQHTKAEEELTSKGKIWIGFAAAAVIAFGLFSGQYISIGIEEDLEEDEDL